MIKAIIFDVGGVLKFSTDLALRQDVQKTLGILPEAFDEPWKLMTDQLGRGVIDESTFWKQLHKLTNAQHPLPNESLLMREYKKGHKANEPVMDIARRLKKQGYKVAALSNTIASHAEFDREKGIYNDFETVILSHEVGLRKPSLEFFEYTLKQLKVAPQEALLIDDMERNIVAAQQIGMHAILFTDATQLEKDLKQLGVSF